MENNLMSFIILHNETVSKPAEKSQDMDRLNGEGYKS